MAKGPLDMGASVRARLLNLARERGQVFDLLLTRYALEPGVEEVDLPVLLDLPAPRLRAYARETVVAEKFQAMVALGKANSRMKDFCDVWVLSKTYDFNHARLAQAIAATFARRQTAIPEAPPDSFTPEFFRDEGKLQRSSDNRSSRSSTEGRTRFRSLAATALASYE
jgi:hypothetical protein